MHTKLLILIVFKPRKVKDSMRRVEQRLRNSLRWRGPKPNTFQKYATTSVEIICSELSFYLRFDLRVKTLRAVYDVESVSVRCVDPGIYYYYLLLIIIIKIIKI